MHYGSERTYGARIDDGWKYRGVDAVVIENELLRAILLPGKGADVYSLVHKPTDTEFLWRSPWGVRNPATYVPGNADPGQVWIDYYEGGWQTILPNGGNPASYKGASFGQHGDVNLMPWDCTITEDSEQKVSARFFVRLARMPLTVTKEVSLEAGSGSLVMRDVVRNVSKEDIPIVFGQHLAFGAPFLSGDCVLDIPGGMVNTHPAPYSKNHRWKPGSATEWPKSILVDGGEESMREVPPEGAGYDDQGYITEMPEGWYALTNTQIGVGLAVTWPVDVFKCLWYWQMFSGGEGYPWWGRTYNCGLEPFTSYPNTGLAEAIENGTAHILKGESSLETLVTATAYSSSQGVKQVSDGGRVTTLD